MTMDFLISVGKYTNENRNTILDNKMMDSSIAEECIAEMTDMGVVFK